MKYIVFSISLAGIIAALVFSHHGVLDLMKLRKQVVAADNRVTVLEQQNSELRRQLDLLDNGSREALESYARQKLGMSAPGEKVYIEQN